MTDIKRKTFVEDQFDSVFTQKPVLQYEFNTKKMGRKDRRIVRSLLKYGVQGKKCLDIGPGTGRWLQFLNKNGADYLGAIDISNESLKRYSVICDKTQKANVETDNFDFKTNNFDIVLSIEVLEHLMYLDHYLSEIFRVTKNEGLVLMTIPNILSLISRIRVIFGLFPVAVANDKTHVGFYRKKDLVKLLAPYNMQPQFIPTSISLNPLNRKSRFSIPSIKLLSSLEDSFLFLIRVEKK
jgi:ubiquinone/menaquinone biosynthesis C-methylase UbiE